LRTRALALLLIVLAALPAAAAPPAPLVEYSRPAFAAAQAKNQPIVVFVHAAWCVTCRRQQPIVQALASDPAFAKAGLVVFVVDYADKATLQALKVTDRSTLVAYRGAAERARSSFETDAAAIRTLFEKAL
jgi:thiol-disulfide isomerase/thioredoxin